MIFSRMFCGKELAVRTVSFVFSSVGIVPLASGC